MHFSLFVPEYCPDIFVEFPPPWRNLRISRRGVDFLPATQWPEATILDGRTRSPLAKACSRAREALRLAERNREEETREAWRLEQEADCGVALDKYRNVSPASHNFFRETANHRRQFCFDDAPLSTCRQDARKAKEDLPPLISWPPFRSSAAPFPWCCGSCRFGRSAILSPVVTLIPPSSSLNCPCAIREAVIQCANCNEAFCWQCFTNLDDYFLFS
jgi:hypothetical protein